MSNSELYEKGLAMRAELHGGERASKSREGVYAGPLMEKFLHVAIEFAFGGLWTRPGLDIKTRCMVCVISDATSGRTEELEIHLRFALRHGWSEEELGEALLHLSAYIGLPLVRGATLVAERVFEAVRAEQAAGAD